MPFFLFVEKHDAKGTTFSQADLDHSEIFRSPVADKLFTCFNNDICSNYNMVGINQLNAAFGVGMQRKIVHNNTMNFKNNFMNDDSLSVQAETQSAWDELYPHFKELVSNMEDEDNASEKIIEVNALMDELSLRLRGNKPQNSCLHIMVNICR